MTYEEAKELFEIYKETKSLDVVAANSKFGRHKISHYLDHYGFKKKAIKEKTRKYNKEFVDKLYSEYKTGSSTIVLGKKYDINPSHIVRFFNREGYKLRSNKINSRRFFVDETKFSEIESEEDAYWLGFMYADGYVSVRDGTYVVGISLGRVDENHLYEFKKYINATYDVKRYTSNRGYSENCEYSRLAVTSEALGKNLIKQGCVLNKTDILKPPNIKRELIKHFLRGYFDGDGSLFITNGSYTINIVGTLEICEFFQNYLLEEGLVKRKTKIDKRKKEHTVCYTRYGGNYQVLDITNHLYDDATIYLERKYIKYKELCELVSRTRK